MPTQFSGIPVEAARPNLKLGISAKGTAPRMIRSNDYELMRKITTEYTNAWEAHRREQESLIIAWKQYDIFMIPVRENPDPRGWSGMNRTI